MIVETVQVSGNDTCYQSFYYFDLTCVKTHPTSLPPFSMFCWFLSKVLSHHNQCDGEGGQEREFEILLTSGFDSSDLRTSLSDTLARIERWYKSVPNAFYHQSELGTLTSVLR